MKIDDLRPLDDIETELSKICLNCPLSACNEDKNDTLECKCKRYKYYRGEVEKKYGCNLRKR